MNPPITPTEAHIKLLAAADLELRRGLPYAGAKLLAEYEAQVTLSLRQQLALVNTACDAALKSEAALIAERDALRADVISANNMRNADIREITQLRAEVERLTIQAENLLKPVRDRALERAETAEAEIVALKQAIEFRQRVPNEDAERNAARAEKAEAELKAVQNHLDGYWRTNPDTASAAEAAMKDLNAFRLAAEIKKCPHVVSGPEQTSYCQLAESSVKTARDQRDKLKLGIAQLVAYLNANPNGWGIAPEIRNLYLIASELQ